MLCYFLCPFSHISLYIVREFKLLCLAFKILHILTPPTSAASRSCLLAVGRLEADHCCAPVPGFHMHVSCCCWLCLEYLCLFLYDLFSVCPSRSVFCSSQSACVLGCWEDDLYRLHQVRSLALALPIGLGLWKTLTGDWSTGGKRGWDIYSVPSPHTSHTRELLAIVFVEF